MVKEKVNKYIENLGKTITENTFNISHIKYVYEPLINIVKKCNKVTGIAQAN